MAKKPKSTAESFSELKLDSSQVSSRRVPLEEADFNSKSHNKWVCGFCNKRFVAEASFMKHHCEPKRRMDELRSPLGQAAYGFYRDWMKAKGFSQPGAAAFLESKFYRSFINFTEFVQRANIARPDHYMAIMIDGEIQPVLWCRDECYARYLEWVDHLTDPFDQVQETANYLLDISVKEKVEFPGIFTHLGPQRVLTLVRQRRLSPWLIFCSPSFGKLLKQMDGSQLKIFNEMVSASYWGERFQKEHETIKGIKKIVKELGL